MERLVPHNSGYHLLKESIDARRRHDIHRVVSVEVFGPDEKIPVRDIKLPKINYSGEKPLIIGAGPAGLFAALRFVERGIPCKLFERGSTAEKRLIAINRFWRYGELNPEDNVCFGEGGAGLYSDGKLMTRIKSPHIPYIMRRLVEFGAPEEIEYLANPHVGSDRIRRIIPVLRKYLIANGCEFFFNTKVEDLLMEEKQITGLKTSDGTLHHSPHVILATGHSAKDIFHMLHKNGVELVGKSFALGLRVEHPQKLINSIQYRGHADHPKLGSANYKLTHFDEKTKVGTYSFCMCPGGYILSSGTDADGIVCNGMSNYHRNSPFANSGIVVSIDYEKNFGKDIFAGLEFQHSLEKACKDAVTRVGGTKQLPAQKTMDFLNSKTSDELLKSSTPSGISSVDFNKILPPFLVKALKEGLANFAQKMPGFDGATSQLHGIESRTSSPLRVPRNPETFESTSHQGLYPVGEGAGYAGGITSAAADGINAAEAIMQVLSSQTAERENTKPLPEKSV
ncbi:MAG: NAD(P)/FAD-dependent oxidoreductase [Bdellovibrionales bacterium]